MFQGIDPRNEGASPEEVFSHMKLTEIFFSNLSVSPVKWEIWYEHDLDRAGIAFCVEMRDWKYDGFSMNGSQLAFLSKDRMSSDNSYRVQNTFTIKKTRSTCDNFQNGLNESLLVCWK